MHLRRRQCGRRACLSRCVRRARACPGAAGRERGGERGQLAGGTRRHSQARFARCHVRMCQTPGGPSEGLGGMQGCAWLPSHQACRCCGLQDAADLAALHSGSTHAAPVQERPCAATGDMHWTIAAGPACSAPAPPFQQVSGAARMSWCQAITLHAHSCCKNCFVLDIISESGAHRWPERPAASWQCATDAASASGASSSTRSLQTPPGRAGPGACCSEPSGGGAKCAARRTSTCGAGGELCAAWAPSCCTLRHVTCNTLSRQGRPLSTRVLTMGTMSSGAQTRRRRGGAAGRACSCW
jgi:hypothetical protein